MKAEHRHELKTNELAEWITEFPQWAKKNLKSIIYVAVLVVVVAGLYIYNWHKKNVVLVQREIELTKQVARVSNQKTQIIQAQAQGVNAQQHDALAHGLLGSGIGQDSGQNRANTGGPAEGEDHAHHKGTQHPHGFLRCKKAILNC